MSKNIIIVIFIVIIAVLVALFATGIISFDNTNNKIATNTSETTNEITKTGIIIEATKSNLIISAPDGTTYKFSITDNTKFEGFKNDSIGNTVEVKFVGDYKDSIPCTVVNITKESDMYNTQPTPTNTEKTNTSPTSNNSDPNATRYVTGKIVNASMNGLQFTWKGQTYFISKDDNTIVEGDLLVGSTAKIYHKGYIKDGLVATKIEIEK